MICEKVLENKIEEPKMVEKKPVVQSKKCYLLNAFYKAKNMLRHELLVFFHPSEIVKVSLLCKHMYN